MYDLGEQFKFNLSNSIANESSVFKGNHYRITVLTERLVRLEYSDKGIFNDYPSELVWYRNLPTPEFDVNENDKILQIKTKYFELIYNKEKKFKGGKFTPTSNLKINLLNTDKVWYYNHPEARNYGTSPINLDSNKFVKGLYSLDGFATIDDSKTPLILENGSFRNRESNNIDIYVFLYNKDFYYCLSDYFSITGNSPLIPRYALGNWWCKRDFYDENTFSHIINKFEEHNIPISVFMLDNWKINNKYTDIFRNPKSLSSFLNSKNIKFGLTINDPIIFKNGTIENEKVKPYLNYDKNGNIDFNLMDERSIDAYLKLIYHPLKANNIDLFFINNFNKYNEERNFIFSHYLYTDKYNVNNNRPIICSINSLIAPHRYPIVYTGKSNVDWETLKKIPKYNILGFNNGISFFSHDFGGSSNGIEDSELFVRFIQLGVFSPILRLGSDSGKYYKREPWKWNLSTNMIVSKFLNMRYKLIPYIYTECYKYYKYGKPLIEPLYFTYPALYDDDLYSNEYYFGTNILICPILSKKDNVMNRVIQKIYLPKGIWYDMFTGKRYTGNKKYVTFYKEDEYPVFVKAGTILPLSLNKYNDTNIPKTMEIDIFPGASNTYSVYEDDGTTENYKKGDYLITNIEYLYKKNNYSLTILPVSGKKGIIPEKRDYKIRFRNTNVVAKVLTYSGNTMVKNKRYKQGNDLIVEISDVPTTIQLTIICSGENIEIDVFRIINEDIVSIISDLPIKTIVKEKIDSIMFSKDLTIKKKRIEIRKLANGKNWIERKYIDLFLKLLEYIEKI